MHYTEIHEMLYIFANYTIDTMMFIVVMEVNCSKEVVLWISVNIDQGKSDNMED